SWIDSSITPTSFGSRAGVGEFTTASDTALRPSPTQPHRRSRNLLIPTSPSMAAFDVFAGGRLWVFGDSQSAGDHGPATLGAAPTIDLAHRTTSDGVFRSRT